MVLEMLENPALLRKSSLAMLAVSFIICSVSIFVSYSFSPDSSGMLSLAFITIAVMPLMHNLFSTEEAREVDNPGSSTSFLLRHSSLFKFHALFFIGLVISYSFWFVALPAEASKGCNGGFPSLECRVPVKKILFKEQLKQFSAVTGQVTGGNGKGVAWNECKNHATRSFESCAVFIFDNNSVVMGLAVLFSFIYGVGAIMLIGWQASVVGVFIGREVLERGALFGIALGIGYLPHGSFEIPAYFLAAIAGGMISTAISRGKYRTHEFEIIAKDVIVVMLIAYIALLIGAFIESWIILQASYL